MSTMSAQSFASVPNAHTIPPGIEATPVALTTFTLPNVVVGSAEDVLLGQAMIEAWRKDGIFQVAVMPEQSHVMTDAYKTSKSFFSMNAGLKAKHVDDQSFAGYIASGEEITDGVADYSEIFTITKDLDESDRRVRERWPCHGSCPWPNNVYKDTMNNVMGLFGGLGERLLHLTALGLGLRDPNALTNLTEDGWHHMRVLRFPANNATNGKGKPGRGIGSHTDYGLLVIASQDDVGGLFVRSPEAESALHNWESSAAGKNEEDNKWLYVPPTENTLTVFPGDMMQYLTSDYLISTPHKVGLNTRERFAFAYFHEPAFDKVVRRLPEYAKDQGIHYGTHFTNMFMRNYPDRVTTKRMIEENRLDKLHDIVSRSDRRRRARL